MAIGKKSAVASTDAPVKLTVVARKGMISLETISPKENSNGKQYIATPFGAVYARLDKIEPGFHTVVELSNGALALNAPTTADKLAYVNQLKGENPNLSADDIKEMIGL